MSIHGIYLPNYKETFGGEVLSDEEIKQLFKSINLPIAVQIITKFNVALWHLFPDPQIQSFLLRKTLKRSDRKLVIKEVKRKLAERQKNKSEDGFTVIFHRHQFLYTLKLLLLTQETSDTAGEELTWRTIGKPLIAINHHLEFEKDLSSKPIEERIEYMREFMVRSTFLAQTANDHGILSTNRIARTVYLWTYIYAKLKDENKINFDFESIFLEVSGMTFTEFIGLGFSSYIQTKQLDPIQDTEDEYIFNINNYFSKTKLNRDKIEAIFNQLTFKADDFPKLYEQDIENALNGTDVFNYNFITFQKHPLIELFDGIYFVIDVGFFSQRVRDGIYWILENHFLSEGLENQRKEFSALKGNLIETYCSEIIQTTFNSAERLKEDSTKQADFLIQIKRDNEVYLRVLPR